MKIFQAAKWGLREDNGKEFYLSLFTTKNYSFLQFELGYEKSSKWSEPPYLQISMGYGKLFSFLFCWGKLWTSFDILGLNWNNKDYYAQKS